jgi:hypothetical protein
MMLENRIRDQFAPAIAPVAIGVESAFVACPSPLFATFTTPHQAFVAEVYRRAQELAEAQLRETARRRTFRLPAFSLN